MRFGTAAIVGRSNVGKSTFLNAALGEQLAIVSPQPQTTRDALLGIVHLEQAQIAFLDTPGLHRPRTELGRRMNATALDAARSTDVVVFMTDVAALQKDQKPAVGAGALASENAPFLLPEDAELIKLLDARAAAPTLLVINKVDLVRDKPRLLPMIEAYTRAHAFTAVVPVSVKRQDGVKRVLAEIEKLLPEGPAAYDPETLTDRPVSFFVREYIREQVMLHTRREVPHAVAISLDKIEESTRVMSISATIHVEKPGQRKIIVGTGGSTIRQIGTDARLRIEELVGRKVYLELFVRVTPHWKDMPRQLAEMGYEPAQDKDSMPELDTDDFKSGGRG